MQDIQKTSPLCIKLPSISKLKTGFNSHLSGSSCWRDRRESVLRVWNLHHRPWSIFLNKLELVTQGRSRAHPRPECHVTGTRCWRATPLKWFFLPEPQTEPRRLKLLLWGCWTHRCAPYKSNGPRNRRERHVASKGRPRSEIRLPGKLPAAWTPSDTQPQDSNARQVHADSVACRSLWLLVPCQSQGFFSAGKVWRPSGSSFSLCAQTAQVYLTTLTLTLAPHRGSRNDTGATWGR